MTRAFAVAVCLLTACSETRPAEGPSPSPTVVVSDSGTAAVDPAPPPVPTAACPLVPMKLLIDTPERGDVVMATLDASGVVGGPPGLMAMSKRKALAHFDDRGCLYDEEGVVAELTADSTLWMLRETLPATGRSVGESTIEADGRIRSARDGAPAMRLSGFEERGLCAGKLLVAALRAMMGGVSMAVVDGVAESLAPPSGSVCPDRHAPRP